MCFAQHGLLCCSRKTTRTKLHGLTPPLAHCSLCPYGQSVSKTEKKTTAFDLRHVPGPWQAAWESSARDTEWRSSTDAPARLLTIPDVQVRRTNFARPTKKVASMFVLFLKCVWRLNLSTNRTTITVHMVAGEPIDHRWIGRKINRRTFVGRV